jgi:hypothetical protein
MFDNNAEAESLRGQMESKFGVARVLRYDSDPVMFRVLVGEEESIEGAERLADRIGRREESVIVLVDP